MPHKHKIFRCQYWHLFLSAFRISMETPTSMMGFIAPAWGLCGIINACWVPNQLPLDFILLSVVGHCSWFEESCTLPHLCKMWSSLPVYLFLKLVDRTFHRPLSNVNVVEMREQHIFSNKREWQFSEGKNCWGAIIAPCNVATPCNMCITCRFIMY